MIETLTLPDGLVVPARGHAADCDVFFARKKGCCCAVAREVRLRALLHEVVEALYAEQGRALPTHLCPLCAVGVPADRPDFGHAPDCRLAAALFGGAS